MSTVKAYIAGPVTGLPDGNKHMFAAAAKWLRENTPWDVVSPLEMDSPEEFAATMTDHYGSVYWQRMVHDFKTVIEVDALVLLPEWQRSKGAKIEVFAALSLGKRFYGWDFDPGGVAFGAIHPSIIRDVLRENLP